MMKTMDNDFTVSQSKTTTSTVSDFSKKVNSSIWEHNRSTGGSEPMSDPEFNSTMESAPTDIVSISDIDNNIGFSLHRIDSKFSSFCSAPDNNFYCWFCVTSIGYVL